jgi:hypothetical protein
MRKLIIAVTVLLTSCELVKEVDVDSGPSRLVVNSYLLADSTWSLEVAQTVHILERNYLVTPENVSMNVVSQSGDVIEFERVMAGYNGYEYHTFRALQTPVAGETYTIEASAPNFAPVHAVTTVPARIQLISVSLDSADMIPNNYDNAGSIPVDFTFQDPPGRGDYYIPQFLIKVLRDRYNPDTRKFETLYTWMGFSLTENVKTGGLSLEENVRAISDELFDGKVTTIRLHVNKSFYSSNEPKTYSWMFCLTRIGDDYYKYMLSSFLQWDTSGNPLAQPVQVFTNVEGGLGIFAGASTSSWVNE